MFIIRSCLWSFENWVHKIILLIFHGDTSIFIVTNKIRTKPTKYLWGLDILHHKNNDVLTNYDYKDFNIYMIEYK